MVEIFIAILPILLIIFESVITERYSAKGKKKRTDHERNKEIAEKDHPAKSKRLSDLLDAVKLRNAEKGSNNSPR